MNYCILFINCVTFEQRRNSFINLHRPELKGLNIVSTENRRDKMLQQRILTESKPINQINSM